MSVIHSLSKACTFDLLNITQILRAFTSIYHHYIIKTFKIHTFVSNVFTSTSIIQVQTIATFFKSSCQLSVSAAFLNNTNSSDPKKNWSDLFKTLNTE